MLMLPNANHLLRPLLACILTGTVLSAGAEPLVRPGDHVAVVGGTFADHLRRYGYLETILLQRLRGEGISLRNLGWQGDTLTARDRPTNFPTEDETLADHDTDILLLGFGMSESFAGESGLAEFRADYERLIAHYRANQYNGDAAPRLVLLSPIAYEDLGAITPHLEKRNGELAAYTAAIGEIAAANELGFVDLYTPTRALMNDDAGPKLTTNGIHLNDYGYWRVSRILADALVPGPENWRIEIDFASRKALATGVAVKEIDTLSGGLKLTVAETEWPAPAPPPDPANDPDPTANRDLLVVRNLPDAVFTLSIDGEAVATASADEWARGVPLDASPTHRDVAAYRAQVNDKNAQFFHSWRALNQVHIVGERKKSNSGRALPAEVIEFNKLALEKDENLRTLGDLDKTREWRLTATPEKTTK